MAPRSPPLAAMPNRATRSATIQDSPSGAGGAVVGAGGAGGGVVGGDASAPVSGFSVMTNRYDNLRSGSNTSETILTTSNVTQAKFGLLFSRTIVGSSYGSRSTLAA